MRDVHRRTWVAGAIAAVITVAVSAPARGAQEPKASVSSGRIALPASGETTAHAFLVVENPTMYDFYVVSATTDVAGAVEIRRAGKDVPVSEATVPAYGQLKMDQKGVHLLLKDLKKPLNENDKVEITVVTEVGTKLSVEAVVKKE